jgi:hypothetical protein
MSKAFPSQQELSQVVEARYMTEDFHPFYITTSLHSFKKQPV